MTETFSRLPSNQSQPGQTITARTPITPELVRKVTEQVWLLWKADLTIENERFRKNNNPYRWNRHGGA